MSKIESLVKKALEQSYRDGYPEDSRHTAEAIVDALAKAGFVRKDPASWNTRAIMSDTEATHVLR